MMRLFCNGKQLDLYEDTDFQFTQENPLFAFEDLKCERTTEITLPRTPINDEALSLSRIPATYGEGMRRKFPAELVLSGLTKSGFLYVSSYNKEGYKAILVTGSLSKVANFGNYEWGTLPLPYNVRETPYDANDANIPMIARVKYHTDAAAIYDPYQPSIDIHELLTAINDANLLKITGLTGQRFRLIRNTPHQVEKAQVILSNNQAGSTQRDMMLASDSPLVGVGNMVVGAPQGEPYATTVAFSPTKDIEITFPENTPPNLCLCIPSDNGYGDGIYINFIGGRGFRKENGNIVYYGTPLAGRTFTIPGSSPYRTVRFVLMTAEAAVWYTGINEPFFYWGSSSPGFTGGDWTDVPSYEIAVRVTGMNDMGVYYYNYGLPAVAVLQDLKLGDILKLYAMVTGTLIDETPDGVRFITTHSNTTHEINNVIVATDLERTFAGFSQKSFVVFKDTSNVQEWERKAVTYSLDNENISESTNLIELEASEGGIYIDGDIVVTDDVLLVRGVKNERDDFWEETDALLPDMIVAQTGNFEFMSRISLTKNDYIQHLCDKSTQLQMQARMGMLEYNRIASDDLVRVGSLVYAWVSREWQKDIAKFTLAKI